MRANTIINIIQQNENIMNNIKETIKILLMAAFTIRSIFNIHKRRKCDIAYKYCAKCYVIIKLKNNLREINIL